MEIQTRNTWLAILLVLTFSACQSSGPNFDIYKLPALTEQGVNAVIEIPAGTNYKIEYLPEAGTFELDQIDGKDRIIDFLPYPGNYGFIPSTLMDEARGGDGDALDILVIGETEATASVVEVLPIAALLLNDDDAIDTKIIAVPLDEGKRIIKATNFQDFLITYDAAKQIIENWFLNYKGFGRTKLIGWEDEAYAQQEIKKWIKP